MEAKRFNTSKNDKQEWAEPSGELCLNAPDMRKIFPTQRIDERLDKHPLAQTRKDRQKIEKADRSCNRRYKYFAKQYLPFTRIGKSPISTAEFLQ